MESDSVPMVEPTISKAEAAAERWDVIVVGAGIAGSLASLGLARLGRKVLLIERASLPRDKVCGACLNGNAVGGLRRAGVWAEIESLGGFPLRQYFLRSGSRRITLPLPEGHAVSRSAMDSVLARSAIGAGADLLTDTAVSIESASDQDSTRCVLDNDGNRYQASVIVAASGLNGKALAKESSQAVLVRSDSRIGLGARWFPHQTGRGIPINLEPGTVYMAVGAEGYVGLVLTEGGAVNLAAAVDRAAVQSFGPSGVCDRLLRSCGWEFGDQLVGASFLGTRTMTRRRAVAGDHRLLFVGDASGYVEPFTGEGMAWATRSALVAVPWVDGIVDRWDVDVPLRWTRELNHVLGKQQRRCRWLSRMLRHPSLVGHAITLLSRFPSLGQFAVEQFQREHKVVLSDHPSWDGGAWPSRDAA